MLSTFVYRETPVVSLKKLRASGAACAKIGLCFGDLRYEMCQWQLMHPQISLHTSRKTGTVHRISFSCDGVLFYFLSFFFGNSVRVINIESV